MTLVQIGGKRGDGPTFEQPFEMMEACHERLHRMLGLLQRLRAHLPQHGADGQARQAARDIMKYFDQAAPQHHRDEELHVFPPLLARDEADEVAVVQRLQAEHLEMDARWAALRVVLGEIAAGRPDALSDAEAKSFDEFAALQLRHVDAEEQVAYPCARERLDAPALRAMGAEMAARRGVR